MNDKKKSSITKGTFVTTVIAQGFSIRSKLFSRFGIAYFK